MNKYKMKNNRQPGNAPGKFSLEDENTLNVANLTGNTLSNDAGFTAGGPNAPMASFARNANVTTPTQATATGFGNARLANPGGEGDGNSEVSERKTVDVNRGSTTASQRQAALNKKMSLKNRVFKNQKLNTVNNKLSTSTSKKFNVSPRSMAIQQRSVRGNSDAVNTSANTNRLA
tara:strand:+ start:237 stop:761 length:525 start_codon:yes stop_codon:yes gene_type:complete